MVNITLPVLTLFSMFYIFGWFRAILETILKIQACQYHYLCLGYWIINIYWLLWSYCLYLSGLYLLFIFIYHTVNIIIITIVVLLLLLLSLSSSNSVYLVILLFVHYLCITFCVHLCFCLLYGMQVHDLLSSEKYLEPNICDLVRRCSIGRSSRLQMFLKYMFFKNFTWKHLCWSFFLIKLQVLRPATLLKTDSNTGVFLWNLRNL